VDFQASGAGWQARQRQRLFFTWSAQRKVEGFALSGGKGARFQVAGGEWLWDFGSQIYNLVAGHGHSRIQERMIAQIREVPAAHPHALLPVRAEVGELLHRHTGLAKAFLTTGGSEAVENAIKIARLYTKREKVITRRVSYHGATLAVLGVSGDARREPFVASLGAPYYIEDRWPAREATSEQPSDWLESLELLVRREGPETIAAILLEGLTGVGGMQAPPRDFWPGVRALCDRYGIVLVDDEILSGCGRSGAWWAHQHWGASPDIIVVGKGITSGYAPMAGAVVSQAIADHFDDEVLCCGLTCFAHPVSCAAAVATLRVLEEEGLVDNAARLGPVLRERLQGIAARQRAVVELRGRGLMQGIVLAGSTEGLGAMTWKHGVSAPTTSNMLLLCPPLCITEDELHDAMDRVDAALSAWSAAAC
jgi:taurine---2-oxoglutarate transaminase